jgi:hypothetical protein
MAYLRQFRSNFFGRAATEIRAYYDEEMAKAKAAGQEPHEFLKFMELRYGHIPDFSNAKIPTSTELPLSPELFDEWWATVTAKQHTFDALVALRAMWNGALSATPNEKGHPTVSWDLIENFLIKYQVPLPDIEKSIPHAPGDNADRSL